MRVCVCTQYVAGTRTHTHTYTGTSYDIRWCLRLRYVFLILSLKPIIKLPANKSAGMDVQSNWKVVGLWVPDSGSFPSNVGGVRPAVTFGM